MRSSSAVAIKASYALAVCAAVYFRIHVAIYPFFLPILLTSAFIWGDWEERVVAGALVVTLEVLAVGPPLNLFAHSFDVAGSRVGVTIVGAVYLAVLLVVAVRSEKWWPSWATAFQILIVLTHPMFVLMRKDINPWAYASGIVIWTWLQLIAIGFGIFDAWLARPQPPIIIPTPDGATRR
jgi:hypothetical protein